MLQRVTCNSYLHSFKQLYVDEKSMQGNISNPRATEFSSFLFFRSLWFRKELVFQLLFSFLILWIYGQPYAKVHLTISVNWLLILSKNAKWTVNQNIQTACLNWHIPMYVLLSKIKNRIIYVNCNSILPSHAYISA